MRSHRSNSVRRRLATARKRVLRGAEVTRAAKRRQRVCRPRNRVPKSDGRDGRRSCESGRRNGGAVWPGAEAHRDPSAGACTRGSPGNLGDLASSFERAGGEAGNQAQARAGRLAACGAKTETSEGRADRTKRK